jgi:hypothetical protein
VTIVLTDEEIAVVFADCGFDRANLQTMIFDEEATT